MAEAEVVEAGEEPSLEDVLSAAEPEAEADVKPEETAEPETEAAAEETSEAEAEEPEKPDTSSTSDDEPMVPREGLLDERKKRQQLEAVLKDPEKLKEHLARLEEADTGDKLPSPFEDEDGFVAGVDSRTDQKLVAERVKLSRSLIGMVKEDWPDREQQFMTLVDKDPTLVEKMLEAENPALFAYDTAVEAERIANLEAQNSEEGLAKLKEEHRKEFMEEFGIDPEKAEKPAEETPDTSTEPERKNDSDAIPSLANQRSTGGADEVITDNESLEDVLGR